MKLEYSNPITNSEIKQENPNINLNYTLNQITNSNNTNKFNNFTANENLGYLNSSNLNQNSSNLQGMSFQEKLNSEMKNNSFVNDNSDQAHQRNLRFSFNMLGKTKNLNNKSAKDEAVGSFNKENIYEKIDISNDNINLNEEESSARKNKLSDSDNKSNSEFLFGKGIDFRTSF